MVVYIKMFTCGVRELKALNYTFLNIGIAYYYNKISYLWKIETKGRIKISFTVSY